MASTSPPVSFCAFASVSLKEESCTVSGEDSGGPVCGAAGATISMLIVSIGITSFLCWNNSRVVFVPFGNLDLFTFQLFSFRQDLAELHRLFLFHKFENFAGLFALHACQEFNGNVLS